ncbi:hypothetical protein PHYBOEH_010150 [Phytophthora boehmeriae]|uniref:Myb/SANT-like DNA-binding domain-containing protein n=1 Tax=Phytophthora boehmeriae TaxID=109152 RepID=A0A8T1VPH1_9STRA|nr:hypothetical protein PHYBOEH_010150 [Phytophthora boehmeriae]
MAKQFIEEKRGRGRPPANGNCIVWTESMVEILLHLRFETFVAELSVSRGSKSLKQAWASLAEELSSRSNVAVSVEQCRNKLKALKSKWLAYHAGGISSEPVCLALMDTFWEAGRHQAMQVKTDRSDPNSSSERPAKRPRATSTSESESSAASTPTVIAPAPPTPASPSIAVPSLVSAAQLLDVGVQVHSQAFADIASVAVDAARAKSTGGADNEELSRLEKIINDRFVEILERQDKQLQLIEKQNQLLAKVVEELKRGKQTRNDLLD